MLFNSFAFLFFFFPLVLAAYAVCGRLQKRADKGNPSEMQGTFEKRFLTVLFLLSFVFYGFLYPSCVAILLLSMAVNLAFLLGMERQAAQGKRKQILGLGIMVNAAALATFKYLHLTAPGISFFTFSQIAFLTEAYKGSFKRASGLEYGLYISFFSKLIQGPIALPEEMIEEFRRFRLHMDWERVFRGALLFVLGLFKKVIIADTLGGAVDFGYRSVASLNSGEALIVVLSYTLQLYFDFSGYCDMGMGISQILGIRLPMNFQSPYRAADIMEFWDRWHITLTRFFTRYIYIPLGGSRRGRARTYVNCLAVFLISGLWHGTGVQFLIWGMMHGVLNVFTRAYKEWKEKRKITWKIPRVIGVFFTFLYVNAAWVFFRAPSVSAAVCMFRRIVAFEFGRINKNLAECFNLEEFWYVIKILKLDQWQYGRYLLMVLILALLLLLVFRGKTAVEYAKTAVPGVINVMMMAVLFVWSVLSFSGVSSFLYFNF